MTSEIETERWNDTPASTSPTGTAQTGGGQLGSNIETGSDLQHGSDMQDRIGTQPKEAGTDAGEKSAMDRSKEVVDEAKGQASAVAGEAKQQLASVVDQAKGELRSQFDERGQQAATGLQTLADQLSALSEGRPEAAGHVGSLLQDAQQRVQSYAQTLQYRGPQGMVDDVARFARRRPGTFLLASAVAGFAAGRMARAGAAAGKDQQSFSSSSSPLPPPTAPVAGGALGAGVGYGTTTGTGGYSAGVVGVTSAEPLRSDPVGSRPLREA